MYLFEPRKKVSIWERLKNLSAVSMLILVTTLISILGFILWFIIPESMDYFALKPDNILAGKYLWTLLTHMFFHAGLFHLFVNMLSFFFIGLSVERIIGRKRFVWFYLISGVISGLFYVGLAYVGSNTGFTSSLGSINQAGVGASGALFGLLGILAMLIPNKKIYLITGPIILILLNFVVSPHLSGVGLTLFSFAINILIFLTLFSFIMPNSRFGKFAVPVEMSLWFAPIAAILPLVVISFYVDLPIANTAHFGGLLVGLGYGYYLRIKYRRKVNLLSRYFR